MRIFWREYSIFEGNVCFFSLFECRFFLIRFIAMIANLQRSHMLSKYSPKSYLKLGNKLLGEYGPNGQRKAKSVMMFKILVFYPAIFV